MKTNYKIGQHIHRLVPCPDYEIEMMESWLTDMAKEGLFLVKDGFFAGFATFEYKTPKNLKYRLEAVQKNPSMFSDDGGEPDPEQIELSQRYSWEYMAKYRNFYIYCSEDPSARELNTDPQVQAMALNKVKWRAFESILCTLLLMIVYPILMFHGCLVWAVLNFGSVFMLIFAAALLFMLITDIRAFLYLLKIQNALKNKGYYESEQNWRKGKAPYLIRKVLTIVLVVVLVGGYLKTWGDSLMDTGKIKLEEYNGSIPFASIKDFAGEGSSNYQITLSDLSSGFNTILQKSDWIAPVYIQYNEHARLQTAEGQWIDGGLYVEFAEMRSEALARELAQEYLKMDQHNNKVEIDEELTQQLPANADYAVVYNDEMHFANVIFQKGCKVVKAYFYQTSEQQIPFRQWSQILYDSIQYTE